MSIVANAGNEGLLMSSPFDYNAAYTMAAWVNITAVDATYANGIFAILATNYNDMDDLYVGTGGAWTMRAWIGGASTTYTGATISVSTWYHVAMARSGVASLQFFLNGVATGSPVTRDVTGRTAAVSLVLAHSWSAASGFGNAAELNGSMAHAKIWTAALTEDELKNEMKSIRPVRMANLWAWYPLLAGT